MFWSNLNLSDSVSDILHVGQRHCITIFRLIRLVKAVLIIIIIIIFFTLLYRHQVAKLHYLFIWLQFELLHKCSELGEDISVNSQEL